MIQRDRTDAAALDPALRRADEPPELDVGPPRPTDPASVEAKRREARPVTLAAIAAGIAVAVVLLGRGVPYSDALAVFDETQTRDDEIPYLADATAVAPLESDTARAVDENEFAASGLTIVLPNPFTGATEFDPNARTGPTAL